MAKMGDSNNSKGRGAGGKGRGAGGKGKGAGGKAKGKGPHKGKPTSQPPRKQKKVKVVFNPTDRHDYLTGFSTRKKERRAFGLAMQKVKDRQAKLEERKEQREAQLEKIEDIERNKKALRTGLSGGKNADDDDGDEGDNAASGDNDANPQREPQCNEQELKTFQDEHTTHQFGGLVSVTTTFGIPSDDDDDDVINSKKEFFAREKHGAGHVDEAQERAGNVHKYIPEVKGTMGQRKSKKNGGGGAGRPGGKKGQHGASSMKGMGNAANLKMAQKTLAKFTTKGGKGAGDERGGGGKGKKRKGRK